MTVTTLFSSVCPINTYGLFTLPDFLEWDTELINPFFLPEKFSLNKEEKIVTRWNTKTPPKLSFKFDTECGNLMPKKSIIIKVFAADSKTRVNQYMQNFELQTLAKEIMKSELTTISSSIPFIPLLSFSCFCVAIYKRFEGY